jgi:hypothetical protein
MKTQTRKTRIIIPELSTYNNNIVKKIKIK